MKKSIITIILFFYCVQFTVAQNHKRNITLSKILSEKIEIYVNKYEEDCPVEKFPIILVKQIYRDSCLSIRCTTPHSFSGLLCYNNKQMILYAGIICHRHIFISLDLGYNNITKNAAVCADATANWNKELYEMFIDMDRLENTKEYDEKFEGGVVSGYTPVMILFFSKGGKLIKITYQDKDSDTSRSTKKMKEEGVKFFYF